MLRSIFREARLIDIPEIVGLLMELFSLESDFKSDRRKQETALALLVKDSNCRLFVLEWKEKIIATASCQRHISTSCGGYVGVVEDVIVQKEFRGQGVGSLLMKSLVKKAKDEGLLRLTLLADKNNTGAIQFYKNTEWESTNLAPLFKYIEPNS